MTEAPHLADTLRVFLFGFERSGTTLLSLMVGAHPRVAVPLSTTGLWYRYAHRLAEYNQLRTAADVERLVDDLLREERIRLWDVRLDRDEVLAGLEPGSLARVMARFHRLYAHHKGKDLCGNIDIDTLDYMDEANGWFPDTKFIHIVRDGRDVALSHETYVYGASNIGECAARWARSVELNLKMGAILGAARYAVVRYEDLVLHPETTLRRICGFIGVEYAPEMLEYRRMVEEKIPEDRRFLWPLIDKPLKRSNALRWKAQMSTTQRIVFERAAGEILAKLGYETYDAVPKRLRANLLELWYFLDEGGRFQRLADKVGLGRQSKLQRHARRSQSSPSNVPSAAARSKD